ncbi:GNAT family N-acetyltransferase [Bacillus sp. JJ1764]|uniref:GNAT family N-acetyltransferase n=1 Tax=Bacillus sp. JJ1764 TaxID=3122964 RepID=UPI002FFFB5F5
MKFPILETERLKLIELTHHHVDCVFEIFSMEEVIKFYGTDRFTIPAEAASLIELFRKNFVEKRGIRWGIKLKESQRIIGTLGLNGLQLKNKRAEIGYELHPAYWRKGYTSEAITSVLKYSFDQLDLFRIGAVVLPENEPSLTLLRKLGFNNEGLLRSYIFQNGEPQDTYILSLLKTEWKKAR